MGQFFLGESLSRIYPNMCAKFGCGATVVSKKMGGTDRQRDIAALSYNIVDITVAQKMKYGGHGYSPVLMNILLCSLSR